MAKLWNEKGEITQLGWITIGAGTVLAVVAIANGSRIINKVLEVNRLNAMQGVINEIPKDILEESVKEAAKSAAKTAVTENVMHISREAAKKAAEKTITANMEVIKDCAKNAAEKAVNDVFDEKIQDLITGTGKIIAKTIVKGE